MADLEDVKDCIRNILISDAFQDGLDGYYQDKLVTIDDRERYTEEAVFTSAKFNTGIYPCLELHSPVSRNSAENSDGPIELLHEIGIFYFYRHEDEEQCNRHVERFFAWLRRYFKDNPYLKELKAAPITMDDDNYSPFVPEHGYDGRPFIQCGTITVYVRTFD